VYRLALCLICAFAALEARTRKGDKLVKEGRVAEGRKDFDAALTKYEEALTLDPRDPEYLLLVRKARFNAGQAHVDQGQKLRNEGKLEEALAEFRLAFAIDPSSSIAEQEMRRVYQMIQKAKGGETKPEDRAMTPAQITRRDTEERMSAMLPVPELKPVSPQINNLKMANQSARVLFETVAKLAGVNVLFDPDFLQQQSRNFSLDLNNSTLEEALDYLSLLTKAYWKPLSANAIFVTQDQVTKRREYEENVVKVFYLQNVTSQQELNEIAGAIRAVTNIRQLLTYTAQMAILVRGTADQVALAQKLVFDVDKPKSEVVIDIMVLEANRTKTRSLAATPFGGGLNIPVAFTPRGSTSGGDDDNGGSTGSAITLNRLGKLSSADFSTTLPGATIQALLDDRQTRVLQNPQIRTLDNVKGTLKIGDRYPYATGSFQPGVGGVGVNPLVSTQFQFAEVGVNVDITPKIHGSEEVSMHVEIELSNIRDQVDVGGLRQPVIGQRKIFEDIRLREGEVSVIGGLSSLSNSRTSSGLPGLTNLPGIGFLFGNQGSDRSDSELLIVLVPRVVRGQDLTEANLRGVAAGNEQNVRVGYAPRKSQAPAPEAAPGTAPPAPKPETPKPDAPAPQTPAAAPAQASVVFAPASASLKAGGRLTAELEVRNANDLFSAPFRINFDKKLLRLVEVSRGPAMVGGGQPVSFSRDLNSGVVKVTRLPGAGGVPANGSLVTVVFEAIAPGTATVTVDELLLQDSKLQYIQATAAPLTIVVQN
jgi:general secretion pathway protein D